MLDRLTAQDLLMLGADDFGWSEDIGVLAVLDGTRLLDGDGRVRIDEVRRRLEPKLHLVPRFRQLLYRPRRGLGWPLWVDAASFDLADHVRVHPLAAPGDQAQLLAACEQLYAATAGPVPAAVGGCGCCPACRGDGLACSSKPHHAIADGMAGVAAFGALLDLAADAAHPGRAAMDAGPGPDRGRAAARQPAPASCGGSVAGCRASPIRPARCVGAARWPAWREFFAERRAPRTSLNRPIGADRRLAIVRSRLDVAKQVAHAHQAKVNDVVLAAVAGGLRQLLAGRGEDVQELVLRAMVPISLHREQPGRASGNQDAVMVVPLPLGEPDPVRRLQLIAAETAARKRKARPQMGSGIFGFVAVQRVVLGSSPASGDEPLRHQRARVRRCRCTLPGRRCWSCSPWWRSWAT